MKCNSDFLSTGNFDGDTFALPAAHEAVSNISSASACDDDAAISEKRSADRSQEEFLNSAQIVDESSLLFLVFSGVSAKLVAVSFSSPRVSSLCSLLRSAGKKIIVFGNYFLLWRSRERCKDAFRRKIASN